MALGMTRYFRHRNGSAVPMHVQSLNAYNAVNGPLTAGAIGIPSPMSHSPRICNGLKGRNKNRTPAVRRPVRSCAGDTGTGRLPDRNCCRRNRLRV